MNRSGVHIGVWLFLAFATLLASCSTLGSPDGQISAAKSTQTVPSSLADGLVDSTLTFTPEPTTDYGTPEPPTPFIVEDFADFEMNIASGEAAADFTAPLLDGSTFRLSDYRGEYVLVFPTVVGCGDCVFGINVITFVNEASPNIQLEILIMDLYVGDSPAVWTDFANQINHSNISWGVAGSDAFAVDYEIDTLGTMLLVNPEGKVVFRSKHPITYYQLEALFGLIEDEYLSAGQGS